MMVIAKTIAITVGNVTHVDNAIFDALYQPVRHHGPRIQPLQPLRFVVFLGLAVVCPPCPEVIFIILEDGIK
jgi:hypothetical protein